MSRRSGKGAKGPAAWDKAFAEVDQAAIVSAFGVELEPEVLRLALTHRSFANENGGLPNNERLEFLGDAVLGLSVAAKLYSVHPNRPESDISKMRANVVSRYGLAAVARTIDLGQYVLLGQGELQTGGRDKDSILADTMEAIIGAVYQTYGFEVARAMVLRLFEDNIAKATVGGQYADWKTTLQELASELGVGPARYELTRVGPDHDPTFTATCTVDGDIVATGTGPNKKTAERTAAEHTAALLAARYIDAPDPMQAFLDARAAATPVATLESFRQQNGEGAQVQSTQQD